MESVNGYQLMYKSAMVKILKHCGIQTQYNTPSKKVIFALCWAPQPHVERGHMMKWWYIYVKAKIYINFCPRNICIQMRTHILNYIPVNLQLDLSTECLLSCLWPSPLHSATASLASCRIKHILVTQICSTRAMSYINFVMQQKLHQMSKPDAAAFRKVTWLSTRTAYHNARFLIIANSWVVTLLRAGAARLVLKQFMRVWPVRPGMSELTCHSGQESAKHLEIAFVLAPVWQHPYCICPLLKVSFNRCPHSMIWKAPSYHVS